MWHGIHLVRHLSHFYSCRTVNIDCTPFFWHVSYSKIVPTRASLWHESYHTNVHFSGVHVDTWHTVPIFIIHVCMLTHLVLYHFWCTRAQVDTFGSLSFLITHCRSWHLSYCTFLWYTWPRCYFSNCTNFYSRRVYADTWRTDQLFIHVSKLTPFELLKFLYTRPCLQVSYGTAGYCKRVHFDKCRTLQIFIVPLSTLYNKKINDNVLFIIHLSTLARVLL